LIENFDKKMSRWQGKTLSLTPLSLVLAKISPMTKGQMDMRKSRFLWGGDKKIKVAYG
jgi:hypothetical protein